MAWLKDGKRRRWETQSMNGASAIGQLRNDVELEVRDQSLQCGGGCGGPVALSECGVLLLLLAPAGLCTRAAGRVYNCYWHVAERITARRLLVFLQSD
jgi:hypothetical protein